MRPNNQLLWFLLCFLLMSFTATAQNYFIENKGQWPDEVLYATDISGGKLFVTSNSLVFNFYDKGQLQEIHASHHGQPPTALPEKLKMHAYAAVFKNGRASVAEGRNAVKTLYNYFVGPKVKHASGCVGYEAVYLSGLYPNTDLHLYHSPAGIKYDLIVKPGGNPMDVKLLYKGVSPVLKENGSLAIRTTVNRISEQAPVAYQISGNDSLSVACIYNLRGNELTFNLATFDPTETLIIDPELIFSSYSGSQANNFGYTATYDAQGNLYAGGSVFSAGYPVSLGAYDGSYAGGTDIGLSKFSADGTALIYSTYLGGISAELPHSIIVNESDELFVLGTTSSADFPTTDGVLQPAFIGAASPPVFHVGLGAYYEFGSDLVISRLSASGGELLASTFMGGSANDGLNTAGPLAQNYADEVRGEIELDSEGNVVVGTCTFSEDFPVTADAFQLQNSGELDGIVFKMNPQLNQLIWSSYYGGSGHDAIYAIALRGDSAVIATGGTNSPDLILPGNAFQSTYAGGQADGFVINFSHTNSTTLSAGTYFGSDKYDQLYFVDSDADDNIYVFGQTRATGSFFIHNAMYAQPNSGMLLAKFNPTLTQRHWSTVYGDGSGIPNLSPSAFAVDICNKIYMSGWGGAVNDAGTTSGLPTTADAYQTQTDGSDFYIMVLEQDASDLAYATFFGGGISPEHVDGGTSRFDKSGKIYQAVCAGCQGNNDFPTFPEDAYSSVNNSLCNLGVFKFDLDLPLIFAEFSADSVCLPDAVTFANLSETVSGGNPAYHWNFGDGTNSFDPEPTHVYNQPGTYVVTLAVTDLLSCNLTDTISREVVVLPQLQLEVPGAQVSCTEASFVVQVNSFGTAELFTWAADPAFTSILAQGSTDSTITYSSETAGYLYIKIENTSCQRIDSIYINPAPVWNVSFTDTVMCSIQPLTITFESNQELNTIEWSTTAEILSGQNTQQLVILAESSASVFIEAESQSGCQFSASMQISVHPVSLSTSGDTLACTDEVLGLEAFVNDQAQQILWSADPDFNTILANGPVLSVMPDSSQYYYVQAVNGPCSLVDSVLVSLFAASTSITPDQLACYGDSAHIVVYNDFPNTTLTHQWEPEEFINSGLGTSQVWVQVTEPTTFTAYSENQAGCTTQNSTTVYVSELGSDSIFATATPPAIIAGETSVLNAFPYNQNFNYQWQPPFDLNNPNSHSPTAHPDTTTLYTVTIFDQQESGMCAKAAGVLVQVYEFVCGPPNIFVPSAFTPNNDGVNDELFVRGARLTEVELLVYNRWGEVVFQTNNQSRSWDGSYKGKALSPAVYVYHLRARCSDGQDYFEKGNITLIR